MRKPDLKVGDVQIKYDKEKNEIRVWNQGYDSIPFDADDFFEVVMKLWNKIKEK